MCSNPVNEAIEQAYANVGLLANDTWTYQNNITDYKKANLTLWIRFNDVEQRLSENISECSNKTSNEKIVRTVRDTIPLSRLASYNDFVYDEERERLYCCGVEYNTNEQNTLQNGQNDSEAWMLPEVEDLFKRLTCFPSSNWSSVSPRMTSGRELAPVMSMTTAHPYRWLTQTAWPDQLISHYPELPRALQHYIRNSFFKEEELVLPNYSPEELDEKLQEFPCPRYLVETNADLDLHTRLDSVTVRQLWMPQPIRYGGFSPSLVLNAEVPEFQPNTVRQQQYPSIYNTTYEVEMFPYSNMEKTCFYQQQQDHEESPMLCEEEAVQNIPVFLRPPESYFNTETTKVKQKWRKSQRSGAVLSNLIPLTDSDETSLTPQPPTTMNQELTPVCRSSGYYNPTSNMIQNPQKMLAFLDKWLSKIYNPRSTDFWYMATISGRIDKIFQNVQDNYCVTQDDPPTITETQTAPHRPLYSDVLMNEASTSSGCDSKYEELEREALEQYSGSDPALARNHQMTSQP